MRHEFIECSVSDAQAVLRVVLECAAWLSDRGMNHWIDYYTADVVSEKLRGTTVYGLRDGDDLVGIVSLSGNPPSYYVQSDLNYFQDKSSAVRYMSMLAVRPKFQGAGLATDLMKFAEQKTAASGISFIRLDAIREYLELNAFHAKRGYKYTHWSFYGGDNSNFYEKEL